MFITINKKRYLKAKALYDELQTYQKVGDMLHISRERVRQILRKGEKLGMFKVVKVPIHYPTIKEAKKAVRRLGIKTVAEYKEHCFKDSKLPSDPNQSYKKKGWKNWYNFLGSKPKVFYRTYEEAKKATKRLGLKTCAEYEKHYKKDSRLTSNPHIIYKRSWIDWYDFFGKKK